MSTQEASETTSVQGEVSLPEYSEQESTIEALKHIFKT